MSGIISFYFLLITTSLVSGGNIILKECDDASIGSNVTLDVAEFPDGTHSVTLVKGQAYHFKISFTAASGSSTLTNKLYGGIGWFEIPWGGMEPDACKGLSAENTCPIKARSSYTFASSMTVDKGYPSFGLNIIWKLVDSMGHNQVCFKLPAQLSN